MPLDQAVVLREATIEDLATLRRFEQGVITAERPYDPTLDVDPITYYDLEGLLASEKAYVVIAEVDGSTPVASGYIREFDAKAKYEYSRYGDVSWRIELTVDHRLCRLSIRRASISWQRHQPAGHEEATGLGARKRTPGNSARCLRWEYTGASGLRKDWLPTPHRHYAPRPR